MQSSTFMAYPCARRPDGALDRFQTSAKPEHGEVFKPVLFNDKPDGTDHARHEEKDLQDVQPEMQVDADGQKERDGQFGFQYGASTPSSVTRFSCHSVPL